MRARAHTHTYIHTYARSTRARERAYPRDVLLYYGRHVLHAETVCFTSVRARAQPGAAKIESAFIKHSVSGYITS